MFAAPIAKTASKPCGAGRPAVSRPRAGLGNQAALRKFSISSPVQAKLAIGPVNDPLEREADRVAERVVRAPDAAAGISRAPAGVQRKCAACDQEQPVARKADGAAPVSQGDAAGVNDVLASPGRPLDAKTRAFFEPRLGHNFSAVRVHDDARAGASASAIGALAYTAGTDIVFTPGRYAPATQAGRLLLAHELTHVVQQSQGTAAPRTLRRQTPAPAAAPAGKRSYKTCVNDTLASMGIASAISELVWAGCGVLGVVAGIAGSLVGPEGTLTGWGVAVVACVAFATGISVGKISSAFISCAKE